MTNPFAAASTATAPAPAVVEEKKEAPAPAATAPASTDKGFGDPFANPSGAGDGERITDFVGRLLLIKPTEYVREMTTKQGKTDAVRVDMAVLDDAEEPGRIVKGVLLFQQALKREAKAVYDGPQPYLLGRLNKGETGGGNTLYTFDEVDEAEKNMARQFLAVRSL